MRSLSIAQARRVVLAAQGLATDTARGDVRTLRAALRRVGAVQIDSINIVARSHELVLAARVGEHDPAEFDRLVYRRRAGFEYWGHAASYLPIERYRLFLPRMQRMEMSGRGWFSKIEETHGEKYPMVLERIQREGPLAASAFPTDGRRRGSWWDWSGVKLVLEDLFDRGVLLVHDRVRFERRYDLAERVLPRGLDTTPPAAEEAALELTLLAAGALGVATAADLADYFRLSNAEARRTIAEALGSGMLEQVSVEGWTRPAYLLPGTRVPRAVDVPPVLLSPFDSLVWSRERTVRLFDFNYRLEVYVPAGRRQHGYYTMPVLAGERIVARVDPKLDRAACALLLRAVHLEDGVEPDVAVGAVAAAAGRLAAHLRADAVVVAPSVAAPVRTMLRRAVWPAPAVGRPQPQPRAEPRGERSLSGGM